MTSTHAALFFFISTIVAALLCLLAKAVSEGEFRLPGIIMLNHTAIEVCVLYSAVNVIGVEDILHAEPDGAVVFQHSLFDPGIHASECFELGNAPDA